VQQSALEDKEEEEEEKQAPHPRTRHWLRCLRAEPTPVVVVVAVMVMAAWLRVVWLVSCRLARFPPLGKATQQVAATMGVRWVQPLLRLLRRLPQRLLRLHLPPPRHWRSCKLCSRMLQEVVVVAAVAAVWLRVPPPWPPQQWGRHS
jgi:hypothetical protein